MKNCTEHMTFHCIKLKMFKKKQENIVEIWYYTIWAGKHPHIVMI